MIRNSFIVLVSIFFIGLLNGNQAVAQNSTSYELIGTMTPEGFNPMTYKLVFNLQNGLIKGYSISDIGGQNETKARIKGTLNTTTKQIQFTESEIVYTRYKKNNQNMCMPTITGKLYVKRGKTILEGNFKGQFNGTHKSCANGSILLLNAIDLYAQLSKITNKMNSLPSTDSSLRPMKEAINNIEAIDVVREMQGSDFFSIPWESKEINLEIWDDGVDDNDQINLSLSDSSLNETIVITRKKQIARYPFPKNKQSVQLKIKAINEGLYIPNTVKIVLVDQNKKYMILSRLNKDEFVRINLFRKK